MRLVVEQRSNGGTERTGPLPVRPVAPFLRCESLVLRSLGYVTSMKYGIARSSMARVRSTIAGMAKYS